MKNEKSLNFTITFIILGCVIVHGDYSRWQMSVNTDPSVVCCVLCVMGRSDTGPAEYQDSRDRCSDKCCHNHISSRSRDVVVSCRRLLVGDNQLHG